MSLRTVRVPPEVEPVFARAEEVVSRFFRERRDDPTQGTIEIFGERYVLLRAASLSVEFFDLVRGLYGPSRENEADDFARNILYDLAHAVGRADARNFHAKMGLVDPIARLSAGPIHFAHAGWAFVEISADSNPTPGPDYYLRYDHPYSFESDGWLASERSASFPVCIMSAGYSSGWCSESFGLSLVAAEVLCRAHEGEACRFIMAPPDRIEGHIARYLDSDAVRPGTVHVYAIPDFFARKRVEEDLRQRFADELREREAAEAKLRMAQKLEAVGRLAGGIAHDFNNLMAVVIARSSVLASRYADDHPLRLELDRITEAGERASSLTRQLLAFSRAQVLRRDPIDVDSVVGPLLDLLSPLVGEQTTFRVELAAPGAIALLDRSQLEQVVTNLVVNARDAMPTGGVLEVKTCVTTSDGTTGDLAKGDYVQIVVKDNGTGMDAHTLAHLFEPYFTTKAGHGTGLGLATVHGIVQQSGGHVGVSSVVDEGSVFVVSFPMHRPGDTLTPAPSMRPPRDAAPPRRSLHVLLVEDHAEVRAAVQMTLVHGGHRVIVESDPERAILVSDETLASVDLLLTDVVMPGRSGREVALALRARRPLLSVVFMSGYPPEPDMLTVISDARFLAKPFRPAELLAIIDEISDVEVEAG
jgi:two-component system cell cycle sensor histidine kinase/response regulator CckA